MANPTLYYDVLRRPHVTEKTANLQELRNAYAFEVARTANKAEVKKAVETLFSVKVEKVNIINHGGKVRRQFGRQGRTSPWKKAVVTLSAGQTIEVS